MVRLGYLQSLGRRICGNWGLLGVESQGKEERDWVGVQKVWSESGI